MKTILIATSILFLALTFKLIDIFNLCKNNLTKVTFSYKEKIHMGKPFCLSSMGKPFCLSSLVKYIYIGEFNTILGAYTFV